ncbi:NAD(P)-dependent oxidoreductase [soil metagenome]
MTDNKDPAIGFIGLGLMGAAIAERLLARGRRLTVWNLEPGRIPPIVARGAVAAASPRAVAEASDIVLVCVLDTAAVESVVFGKDGVAEAAGPDKILVDHSTANPEPTAAMAARLKAATGMTWVDAPISGGPGFAREGRLTVMAGGEPSAFEAVLPVVRDYAANVTLMGPPGAGQMAKVINQGICGVTYVLMAEVLRLAEESGIDAALIPDCLRGGHADSTLLHFAYPKMQKRDFEPPASLTRAMLKDLHNVAAEAGRLGLVLPLIRAAEERFALHAERGGAMRETCSVYELYRETPNVIPAKAGTQ